MKPLKNIQSKKFLRFVKSTCKKYKVKFTILDETLCDIDDGRDVSGYFTDQKGHKELLVTAPTQILMLSNLVHEFSHMLQWLEQSPHYTARIRGGIDPYLIMVEWLSGKSYLKKTVKNAISKVKLCELDCDRRALQLIDEFKLPINKNDYIYDAIAYQYFLKYVALKRDWIFNGIGLSGTDIKDYVEPTLDTNFEKLPRNIKNAIESNLS